MPEDSLHLDEVDHTLESFFSADRYLNGARVGTEYIVELTYYFEEVCARTVHLVHVTDTGHIVFVGLTPHSLRLGFHTTDGAECGNGTVEHTERTLYLDSKVDVSRGVNQVDFIFVAVVLPESGSSGRSNCDTALLLLLHPVHCSSTVVHFTDFVSKTGVEKDTLGGSGLTGIDMSHNADIARIFKLFVVISHFAVFRNLYSTKKSLRNGSERMRGWPRPSCAYLLCVCRRRPDC